MCHMYVRITKLSSTYSLTSVEFYFLPSKSRNITTCFSAFLCRVVQHITLLTSIQLFLRQDLYPDWAEQLAQIVENCLTPHKLSLLGDTEKWLDTSYSVSKDEYKRKLRLLEASFGDFYITPYLERPGATNAPSQTAAPAASASVSYQSN